MRNSIFLFLLLLASVMAFLGGLSVGSLSTPVSAVIEAIFSYDPSDQIHNVIINLRVPRLLLAFLVGGALALAGYLLQVLVTNPLADPYILGTASGASLGVNIGILLIPGLSLAASWGTSVFAFAGAFLVTLTAILISGRNGTISPHRLLLAGLALSSLAVACTSFLIFFYGHETALRRVIFWSLGSFENSSWDKLPHLLFVLPPLVIFFHLISPWLNILILGENRATNLGLNVKALRWMILVGASGLTAASVSVAGPVGFVGLMVPHFVRGIAGVHGRMNLALSVIFGGAFLLTCDVISRLILPSSVLPVGIITSFLGIPFFVYLLSGKNYRIAE